MRLSAGFVCQYHLRERAGISGADPPAHAGGTDSLLNAIALSGACKPSPSQLLASPRREQNADEKALREVLSESRLMGVQAGNAFAEGSIDSRRAEAYKGRPQSQLLRECDRRGERRAARRRTVRGSRLSGFTVTTDAPRRSRKAGLWASQKRLSPRVSRIKTGHARTT